MNTSLQPLHTTELFAPDNTIAWEFLSRFTYPWEALSGIPALILELGASLDSAEFDKRGETIWVHKSANVAPTAFFGSGIIIDAEAEIRHCAFIRSNAIVGKNSVVGNSGELKNSIMFDKSQVAHFNYVGDSIVGYKAHLGAGVITSNLKSDGSPVTVNFEVEKIKTGLRKFGAILGDNVEVGCNAVLNPGSIVGTGANIYPLSMVRGFVPPNSIYKKQGEVVARV